MSLLPLTKPYNSAHLIHRVKVCGRWLSIIDCLDMEKTMGIKCSLNIQNFGVEVDAVDKNNVQTTIFIPYAQILFLGN